jgi:CheY-like chemotaxis protein
MTTALFHVNEVKQNRAVVARRVVKSDLALDALSRVHRVLVVDDNRALLEALGTILEGFGFQVFTAESGSKATAVVSEHPIDLLITDLGMPDEDGIEIIRRLKKEYPLLKVIAMSGTFGPGVLNAAQHLGADATLDKPMTASKLLDCIRKLDVEEAS